MKFGVPWRAKGIRPETRATAKVAARRKGMPLGDWLNAVIFKQAAQQGPPAQGDDFHGEGLAAVHQRLDDLARRIEQMTRTGPAAYAPRRGDPAPVNNLVERFDRRIERFAQSSRPPLPLAPTPNVQLPPGLDQAVAEIAARQRALNGEPAAAARPAAAAGPTAVSAAAAATSASADGAARARRAAPAAGSAGTEPSASTCRGAGARAAAGAGPFRAGGSAPPHHRPDRDAAQAGRRGSDQCAARRARRDRQRAQRGHAAARDRDNRKADFRPHPAHRGRPPERHRSRRARRHRARAGRGARRAARPDAGRAAGRLPRRDRRGSPTRSISSWRRKTPRRWRSSKAPSTRCARWRPISPPTRR